LPKKVIDPERDKVTDPESLQPSWYALAPLKSFIIGGQPDGEEIPKKPELMTDFPKKTLADWAALAQKECRDKPLDSLTTDTAEGIPVKPLYTAEDLDGLDHVGSLPGMAPFVRGPRATMYAGRPWTVRQYAGFSTA
jgi:hypothetical protein